MHEGGPEYSRNARSGSRGEVLYECAGAGRLRTLMKHAVSRLHRGAAYSEALAFVDAATEFLFLATVCSRAGVAPVDEQIRKEVARGIVHLLYDERRQRHGDVLRLHPQLATASRPCSLASSEQLLLELEPAWMWKYSMLRLKATFLLYCVCRCAWPRQECLQQPFRACCVSSTSQRLALRCTSVCFCPPCGSAPHRRADLLQS